MYFLVGKDTRGTWSDFGGKCEKVDRGSHVNTAAREFYEETLGTICSSKAMAAYISRSRPPLLKSITQNGFSYSMFLCEIPFLPHLCTTFSDVYRYIEKSTRYIEKTEVRYVTYEDLLRLPKRSVFERTIGTHASALATLATASPDTWRDAFTDFG